MIIFHICASIKNFVLDDLSIYPEGKEDIPGPNIILKKFQVTISQTLKNIPVDLILQTPYSELTNERGLVTAQLRSENFCKIKKLLP